jgi:hypothetical protein
VAQFNAIIGFYARQNKLLGCDWDLGSLQRLGVAGAGSLYRVISKHLKVGCRMLDH